VSDIVIQFRFTIKECVVCYYSSLITDQVNVGKSGNKSQPNRTVAKDSDSFVTFHLKNDNLLRVLINSLQIILSKRTLIVTS
jgi:hypothetical protein